MPRMRGVGILLFVTLALNACGWVKPTAISTEEQAERAHQDYGFLMSSHQPLTGRLTLEEAIARALKFNYASELTRIEVTLQDRQLDLAVTQMLPHLAADAGYNWRTSYNAARSIDAVTGRQVLDYAYSQEPQRGYASLQFSWNILDAGVGYFQARQQGYRAMIAVERRRKVIDTLVKTAQETYWKAAVAQALLPKIDPLLADARRLLEASRNDAHRRSKPPAQALDEQQALLDIISQLRHIRNALGTAQLRLATLINVPIDSKVEIAASTDIRLVKPASVDIAALEETSMNLRPELREAAYEEKISRQDIYKEIINMLPGIGLLGSLSYDDNKLLYNSVWGEMGLRASYNLISLIEGPKAILVAKSAVEVAQVRRLALAIAVLTQVNLSVQEYQNAIDELNAAIEMDGLRQDLAASSARSGGMQAEAARIRRELAAIAADYERGRALADAYTALANLYIATGKDLVTPDVDISDLDRLTVAIRVAIAPWTQGVMPTPVTLMTLAAAPSAPQASPLQHAAAPPP